MKNLVTANLLHHPGRTLTSIIGVAVSVILVVLTVGLVRGMLRDRGERETNTGIEFLLYRRDQVGLSVTSLPLTLPVELISEYCNLPGIAAVTPVGQHLEMKGDSGLGIRQIDGVDFESYRQATNVSIIEGKALPSSGDFAIVDVRYAAIHRTKPGDSIEIFDRPFKVTGIYAPETGARMMIPLATMQEDLGVEGKCSMLMVNLVNPDEQEEIARRIIERNPDLRVIFTRDLPKLFSAGYKGFNVFLNVVAGLATTISLLVILLTMYNTVSERTRQIGILKALGASKTFIAGVFIKESLMISGIGVLCGLIIALLVRLALVKIMRMRIGLEVDYLVIASLSGIASGLLGALFPALRAAGRDAVDALNHE
jgi:putative ABC transport system permease protein